MASASVGPRSAAASVPACSSRSTWVLTIDRQLGEGVVASDDPQTGGGQPAESATTAGLLAVVRVLEQQRRDAEGRAKLAEEGRRQYALMLLQQQVQTDIAAQRRGEAQDAYQQVRACLDQVTAGLREGGGPDAERPAENLLAAFGGGAHPSSSGVEGDSSSRVGNPLPVCGRGGAGAEPRAGERRGRLTQRGRRAGRGAGASVARTGGTRRSGRSVGRPGA
jgi:hypothetical protein